MKKICFFACCLGVLSSANSFDTNVYIGATAGKIDKHNYSQFGIGYTANKRLDNNILLGFGNSIYYGEVKSNKSATTVDMDLKAGYEIIQDLRAYAIGSGAVQYYDNSTYTGLGYGASLEYRITPKFAVEGTYKTMNMSKSNHSYDYDTANLAFKIGF